MLVAVPWHTCSSPSRSLAFPFLQVRVHREAAEYIQTHWPYFDRKGGADHLWVFGHDQGGWRIRQKLPLIAKGIFISPFGGGRTRTASQTLDDCHARVPLISCSSPCVWTAAQRGGHLPGHDIVCPSVLYAGVPLGLMNHARRRRVTPQNLAFFQGKLNLHIPYECVSCPPLGPSTRHHPSAQRPTSAPDSSVSLRDVAGTALACARASTRRTAPPRGLSSRRATRPTARPTTRTCKPPPLPPRRALGPQRPPALGPHRPCLVRLRGRCGSKFCVAAAGFGFSTRAYEAAAAGCVPLIMQDGILQARTHQPSALHGHQARPV